MRGKSARGSPMRYAASGGVYHRPPVLLAGFPQAPARLAEGVQGVRELSRGDGFTQLAHQGLVIVEVVQGIESRAEDFVHFLQVMQVAAREARAGVAGAGLVQGACVV